MATVIQLIYLKFSSARKLAVNNWNNCYCFQKCKENTTDLCQGMYCYSTLLLL